MVRLSSVVLFLLGVSTCVIIFLWIIQPDNNWEPYATIIMAVIIPIVAKYRGKLDSLFDINNHEKIEHDKKVFIEIEKLMGQDFLDIYLGELGGQHMNHENKFSTLYSFIKGGSKLEYLFLITQLEITKQELISSCIELQDFIGYKFYSLRHLKNSSFTYLYPDGNSDRCSMGYPSEEDFKIYKDLTQQLNFLIYDVELKYRTFRNTVKTKIYI